MERLLRTIADYERPSVVTCKQYLQRSIKADYQTANDLAGNIGGCTFVAKINKPSCNQAFIKLIKIYDLPKLACSQSSSELQNRWLDEP